MITESFVSTTIGSQQSLKNQRCPECGTFMSEIERRKENRKLFIWYQCGRGNCDGQRLEQMSVCS